MEIMVTTIYSGYLSKVHTHINEFAKVYVLYNRGMPLPLIRRVTGRSIRLIGAYIELIENYSGPEYAFRFAHLGKIFEAHDLKKNHINFERKSS